VSFAEHSDCFIWRCDGADCEKEVLFKPHDFMACVAELRARGWSFHLNDDDGQRDWTHYCAYCNHKRRQTNILDRPLKGVK